MTIAHAYALLGSAQKGRGRGAPAYSLYVNRPVGRVIAAGAYTWGLSPNQVTAVSAVLTFTGVALLALVPPSTALGIGVWLLLAAGYAWDSADGQVARLRGGGSLAGEWLDHVVDAAKLVSLHVAVAIGAFRFFGLPLAWTLVPLGFAIVATVTFFAMILNDLLRARSGVPQAAEAGGSSPLRSVLGLPVDYGVWCLSFVLWGMPPVFAVVYSLLAIAAVLYLVAALPVWFRRMGQLG
ncbi:CDP-alcohol phosphatidyltransferase family protein [Microbacterium hominis]|uniref:CDP-alcohol phosphatidyltransferase family protein n=1 Tax=Microbacterium hominis TaxID=162426 RepID=UPI000768962E|nr:CDP-alcohol phosphatidyltransferase family protein [Microbacterium hominis]KXC04486.1 CDP-alcohol phosphatidyltransferase [Microbacterium hominis]QRY39476.1 CDP-alcohol phosphatidyltransferase family protein [Microbacterium hominis]